MKRMLWLMALLMQVYFVTAQNETKLIHTAVDHINAGRDTAFFNMFDSTFQKQFPLSEVSRAMPGMQNLLGEIKNIDLAGQRDGAFSYKVMGTKSTFHIVITPSKENEEKISSFLLTADNPFFEIIVKRDKINTDNKKTTAIDLYVDSAVKSLLTKSNTPAVSIGIIYQGKTYRYNYGETRIGNNRLPDSKTIYEIASISKPMAATIVASLMNDKKLSLDDEVNKFLPDSIPSLQYGGKKLLIRHLVTHTADLPTLPENFYGARISEDAGNPMKYLEPEHMLAYLKHRGITDTPGVKFRYSNLGYALLGYICEKVTGKDISGLYKQYLFDPLGMKNTFLNDEQPMRDSILPYKGNGSIEAFFTLRAFAPAGAVRSNTDDMLKYMSAQFTPTSKPVSKAIQSMHKELYTGQQQPTLGLSWFINKDTKGNHYNHSGGSAGFTSRAIFSTEHKIAVVVLANALNYDANAIGDSIYYFLVHR